MPGFIVPCGDLPGITKAAFKHYRMLALAAALGTILGAAPWAPLASADERPENPQSRESTKATKVAASAASGTGETILRDALTAMDRHQAVSAKLRQRVDLYGHRQVGSGDYLQQGRGAKRLLRLELKIQVADRISLLQQVCDGQYLWTHRDLSGTTSLARIDVSRAERAWRQAQSLSAASSAAARPIAAASRAAPSSGMLALGGLPQLLSNLDQSFRFRSVTESRLDGISVWTLQGEWEPERLAEMLPDQKPRIEAGQEADFASLAPHVPERVTLMLGRDDLFPYRIEYARRGPLDPKAPDLVGELRSIVLMELYEVQLDVLADARQFIYKPGEMEIIDQTPAYLQSLGLDGEPARPAPPSEAGRLVPVRR